MSDLDRQLSEARIRNAKRLAACITFAEEEIRSKPDKYYYLETGRKKHISQYGLTEAQWLEMVKAQESKCAICGKHEEHAPALAIDHCHETQAVRGLLCRACNTGLGQFRDSLELMDKAIAYLKRHKPAKAA